MAEQGLTICTPPAGPLTAKVRSLAKPVPVTLEGDFGEGGEATIHFAQPEYGVAPGQAAVSSAPGEEPRLLTLGTPMLRSTMERVKLAWVVPEKMPDFRLKIDRPTWEAFSQAEMETRLRGVEIRLPPEGLWVGYEHSTENENPRVTFSIQRGF